MTAALNYWLQRLWGGARRRVIETSGRLKDKRQTTYLKLPQLGPLCWNLEGDVIPAHVPVKVVEHWLAHRFDLLGSGWVHVKHGRRCRGVDGYRYSFGLETDGPEVRGVLAARVNPANQSEASRIWGLVDDDYCPIDWHLDFKSGYRWRESTWYRDIEWGHLPGVDVKVPWELSRMQHLPCLAIVYADVRHPYAGSARLVSEFHNQVLDFLAANPPRYGVNWACTMDVSIRAANLVLAYQLFRFAGVRFEPSFERLLNRSLIEHGIHVIGNLESHAGIRSNHYFANIAGLIFLGSSIYSDPRAEDWLGFGIRELRGEVGHQFLEDGGHFECSTGYHRLALEMAVFSTALLLGLSEFRLGSPPSRLMQRLVLRRRNEWHPRGVFRQTPGTNMFPASYRGRLLGATELLKAVQGPHGRMALVGDNDSGRFFRLSYAMSCEDKLHSTNVKIDADQGAEIRFIEGLDAMPTVAAATALFGGSDPSLVGIPDSATIMHLTRGRCLLAKGDHSCALSSEDDRLLRDYSPASIGLPPEPDRERKFESACGDLREGLSLARFERFGLYVYRSACLFLLVRCRRHIGLGPTGHLHNDQLAVELSICGRALIRDPGTYLYTPFPAVRNRYRSIHAHDTPWPLSAPEPASFAKGLFRLVGDRPAIPICVSPDRFLGMYKAGGRVVAREIIIDCRSVRIRDWGCGDSMPSMAPAWAPAYGVRSYDGAIG